MQTETVQKLQIGELYTWWNSRVIEAKWAIRLTLITRSNLIKCLMSQV